MYVTFPGPIEATACGVRPGRVYVNKGALCVEQYQIRSGAEGVPVALEVLPYPDMAVSLDGVVEGSTEIRQMMGPAVFASG